jgi:hypothetical protein
MHEEIRVLVTGGRDYADSETVWAVLGELLPIAALAHGQARGADSLADYWASQHGVPVYGYPADWSRHGRAAGAIRNRQMLDDFRPDLVVAFPGGKGTRDMVARARRADVRVLTVPGDTLRRPDLTQSEQRGL